MYMNRFVRIEYIRMSYTHLADQRRYAIPEYTHRTCRYTLRNRKTIISGIYIHMFKPNQKSLKYIE